MNAVQQRFEEFVRPSTSMDVSDLVDEEELNHFKDLHSHVLVEAAAARLSEDLGFL